jgi:hypothetical protein
MKLNKSFIFKATTIITILLVLTNASYLKNTNTLNQQEVKDDKLVFNVESGMRLLKNIYKALFDDGHTVEENNQFRKNFLYCIRHFDDELKELYEPKLKEFYSKCYKLKGDLSKWKEDIIKETIIKQVYADTFVEKETQKTFSCGQFLESRLHKTPIKVELKEALTKEFEGFIRIKNDNRIISSMYNQYRGKLYRGAFTDLNNVSRGYKGENENSPQKLVAKSVETNVGSSLKQ